VIVIVMRMMDLTTTRKSDASYIHSHGCPDARVHCIVPSLASPMASITTPVTSRHRQSIASCVSTALSHNSLTAESMRTSVSRRRSAKSDGVFSYCCLESTPRQLTLKHLGRSEPPRLLVYSNRRSRAEQPTMQCETRAELNRR
jgi:hypothetical protein